MSANTTTATSDIATSNSIATPKAMTKGEREDLQRLIKQRERVLKSAAKQRSAELLADTLQQAVPLGRCSDVSSQRHSLAAVGLQLPDLLIELIRRPGRQDRLAALLHEVEKIFRSKHSESAVDHAQDRAFLRTIRQP